MRIAEMLPGQIGPVKALLELCFGDSAWQEGTLRSQLEKPDSRCTVAVEAESVIGFLAFEQVLDEGSVAELAVHPAYRRRGIARQLVDEAIRHAADLSVVFLEVREGNLPAISLYEKLGFTCVGVRKDYYDHPKENAMIMRKSI